MVTSPLRFALHGDDQLKKNLKSKIKFVLIRGNTLVDEY